jgi:carbon-monoxide dehydrogenase small subunit
MIMAAADLLARDAEPTDDEIRHAIDGNICRCTGYHNIVVAIREAAKTMREGAVAPMTASAGTAIRATAATGATPA